jgi:hypothetical protein
VLTAGLKTGAFPSRFVGFQDEFVKQIAYRAKVSAQAFVEGSTGYGLEGADLTRYVQDKLFDAFDEYGRATNTAALNEAKVATYQNDLNPTGSFGWATAGAKVQAATANFPALAANIVAVLKQPEVADQNKAQTMLAALSAAMIKQLTDKLYLQNIKNTIDAIQSPDHQAAKVAGGLAGNFVPYSSALHLTNADPVMREADTFISAMLAKVPGFSQHFPARRDWAGDPITVHRAYGWTEVDPVVGTRGVGN